MKKSLASAPAEVWNRKNEPTDVERYEGTSDNVADIIKQLPATAAGFARRNRTPVILSLVILGTAGLVWYFSKQD